jgi:hypothetical protein
VSLLVRAIFRNLCCILAINGQRANILSPSQVVSEGKDRLRLFERKGHHTVDSWRLQQVELLIAQHFPNLRERLCLLTLESELSWPSESDPSHELPPPIRLQTLGHKFLIKFILYKYFSTTVFNLNIIPLR